MENNWIRCNRDDDTYTDRLEVDGGFIYRTILTNGSGSIALAFVPNSKNIQNVEVKITPMR